MHALWSRDSKVHLRLLYFCPLSATFLLEVTQQVIRFHASVSPARYGGDSDLSWPILPERGVEKPI